MLAAEHRREILASRMLSREKAKKMTYLSQPSGRRELGDLQRTSRDIASIIDLEFSVESLLELFSGEPFEKALEHLNRNLTPRKYARFSGQRGTTIEAQKKANTIQSTKGKELPALLKLQF